MSQRPAIVLSLLLTLAAGAQEAKLAWPAEFIPRFNVPRLAHPPTIDGAIDEAEWRGAARVMGVVWTSSLDFRDRPVAFWVGWDEQHLYLAARSDILPGHRLYRAHRERYDTGVVHDDAYEFGLFLHDRNKLPGEVSSFLKIVLNSLGSGEYMKLYPSIGQNMYNWQPDPRLANRVYEAGGRRWWDCEAAFSLADLQLPKPHAAGDPLDLLLSAPLKNPDWQWLDYPSASGHLVQTGFTRTVLTADQPYVQIEEFSGLHDERLHLRSALYNPSAGPVSLVAHARIQHEDGATLTPVVDERQTVIVPSGAAGRFDLDHVFPGLSYASKQAKCRYTCTVTCGEAVVYSFTTTFRGTDKSYLNARPRGAQFDVATQFNPVTNKLWVSGDTLDAPLPPGGAQPAGLKWLVARDGRTLAAGSLDRLLNYKYEDLLDLPPLSPGRYNVSLSLVDARGEVLLARDDQSFVKKDEAKEFAAWWHTKLGDADKLLKPFEPLKVAGDTLTCTRRAYTLDGLGLPRQIVANGGPLLSAPARLVAVIAGREVVLNTNGHIKPTNARAHQVEFTGKAADGGLRLTATGRMEQDGLVTLALKFGPLAEPLMLDALRVEWPVDGQLGSWMSCIGGIGGNYSARTIGRVPEGTGTVWNTLDGIGKAGSTMTVGNWENNLWVGNEQRGLLWCGDSDKGWLPDDAHPAHSLVRHGTEVVLVNHLISQPFRLEKPRVVEFMYNASPFRHLAPGWRLNQVSAANGFSAPDYKSNEKTRQDYFSILSMPSTDPAEWPYYYAKYKARAEEKARRDGAFGIAPRLTLFNTNQIALRGYMDKTLEPGLYDYFGADWLRGNESLNRSYTDYMVHLMNRQMREGGCSHFYFDISFSRDTKDLVAGFGYRLPDGRIQPASMDGRLRDWYKRCWALAQEHDLYPGAISGHATNSICLRALPFADAVLDSEYPMADPITVYPPDRMIAMSVPEAFGVKIDHLGFMNPAWASMHDSGMGGGGGPLQSPAFRHFGIARPDVRFVPYWRNQSVVKQLGPGLLASLWHRPGAAIIELLNYGLDPEGQQQTRPAALTLDLRALGVPAGCDGERLRVTELAMDDQLVPERYLGQFAWCQALPQVSRWPGGKEQIRRRPGVTPTLDPATGALGGFEIYYHDARFIQVTWDERAIDDQAWGPLFTGADRLTVLDWGLNRGGTRALRPAELFDRVKVATPDVEALAWTRPNALLLRLRNGGLQTVDAKLTLDLPALGVQPRKLWAEFVQCLGGTLVPETGALTVKGLRPGAARLVMVDRD